jgi:hypothetical protein
VGHLRNWHKDTHKDPVRVYNTLIHTKEMTKEELFNHITHIIASPHTAITEHDKRRAVQVFLGFDEYLVDVDVAAGRCDVGDEYDFCSYATEILDELEEL